MTGSTRFAAIALLFALLSGDGASAASVSTPIPYFNRMYDYFADFAPFAPPGLEDLHGATYRCKDYHYRAETPRTEKSYSIRFLPSAHPHMIGAHYYGEALYEDFMWPVVIHRTFGELNYFVSPKKRHAVHTYRFSEDTRYLLVERAIKPKTRGSHRDFMDRLGSLPVVPSQVHPDYMIATYVVCRRASP